MTQQWAEDQAAAVGKQVRQLREQPPKRSAQWLADRTETLGYLVSRSTIADLEIGRRKHVLVSELLVLAKALGVPPILLLYPAMPSGDVEVLPGVAVSSWQAGQWFAGMAPFRYQDGAGEIVSEDAEYESGARLLILLREEMDLREQATRMAASRDRLLAEKGPDDLTATVVGGALRQMEARLRAVRKEIGQLGAQPFPLPENLAYLEESEQ